MVRLTDIPAEVRWEIAARAANSQSVVCDMLVRQIIGDKIDEIWNVIMIEAGRQSKALAESLRLPAGDALEIDSTLGIISSIIMGHMAVRCSMPIEISVRTSRQERHLTARRSAAVRCRA